jgi:hypothetical protein
MFGIMNGFVVMRETPSSWIGPGKQPIRPERRYAPVAALIRAERGLAHFYGDNGHQGVYVLGLGSRYLCVAPREDHVTDMDMLFVDQNPECGRLKEDALVFLREKMKQWGVDSIDGFQQEGRWTEGLTPDEMDTWWMFQSALRGTDSPYPECDGLSLETLVDIWKIDRRPNRTSMNMRIFLKRCRDRKRG